MLNRKLLEILVRLTLEQHKKLRLFLLSPYFNVTSRSGLIVQLYDYIVTYKSEESHPKLQKQIVFARFFPELTFVENQKSQLDSLTSELYGLTKRFLGQIKKDQAIETEGLAMLEFYRRFGMEERFESTVEGLRKEVEKDPARDADYYRKQYQIDMEITTFSTSSNSFQDDANLLSYNTHLDLSYVINKLQVLGALKMQKKVAAFEDTSNFRLFEFILDLAHNDTAFSIPLIEIFSLIAALIDNPLDEPKMVKFLDLTAQYKHLIPSKIFMEQIMAYYRYFISAKAIQSADKGERFKSYLIYKSHYAQGYFLFEGMILINSLTPLVQMAIRNQDAEWAIELLNNHPPHKIYGTHYAEEAYNLLWADYYFSQKNYEAAVEKIEMRLFENPAYSIMADILIIKIYFEQNNELLDYRLKALDQKVRRSKMSANLKERYLNFLRKLDKISKSAFSGNKDKRAKILAEIKSEKNIYERDWLLEKIVAKG